jgi:hypothetical protein
VSWDVVADTATVLVDVIKESAHICNSKKMFKVRTIPQCGTYIILCSTRWYSGPFS